MGWKAKRTSSNIRNFLSKPGFLNRGSRLPLGAKERFSGSHEQSPLLNGSAVILQNPSVTVEIKGFFIDEQGATSVESLWKEATSRERLRTTVLNDKTKQFGAVVTVV